jgi:hypothetical protein
MEIFMKKISLKLTDRQFEVLRTLIEYGIHELNEYSDTQEAITELTEIGNQLREKDGSIKGRHSTRQKKSSKVSGTSAKKTAKR